MKVRLKIDGTDRSAYLPRTGWTLDDSEGKRISTLTLKLEDRAAALTPSAMELKELILDDPDTSAYHFRGIITQIDTHPLEGVGLQHDIVAQEYGWLMEHYFHTAKYTSKTDAYIINNAFTAIGLSAEIDSTTYVQTGRVIDSFVMNNMSLRDMMEALCQITGNIWYVGWDKKLVYQTPETTTSSIILSDDGLNTNYQRLVRTKDYTGMVTVVRIRGGFTLSASETHIGDNDGVKTVVSSLGVTTGPTDNQALPNIWKNIGNDGAPNWSAQTVGSYTAGDTTADFNCVFDFIDKRIQFATAPPNLSNSYKIQGRVQQQFTYDYVDQTSKDLAGGRELMTVINEENVITVAQAVEKAKGIIREKGIAREKVTLTCNADGLRSGMLIKLVNAKMSINKYYSIRRIVTRFLGASLASYELTLTNPAPLAPDVLDMIAAGWKAANPPLEYRDSEILVVSFAYTETALALAEEILEAVESAKTYRAIANPTSLYPFEEGQGATGDDRYGSNDLTLVGSPTWAQGRRGYALQLDGTTQYGKKVGASGLPSTAMTISAFIKLTSLANFRIIAEHDKNSDGGWNLNIDASGNLNFTIKDGVAYLTASKSGIAINTWYHVVGVYDGANVKVYINGVIGTDAALVGKALDAVGDLYVGSDATPGNFFAGLIDELYIFPSALSLTGIETLRDFKDIKRASIAPVCPYWSPVFPEKFELGGKNFENAKKRIIYNLMSLAHPTTRLLPQLPLLQRQPQPTASHYPEVLSSGVQHFRFSYQLFLWHY